MTASAMPVAPPLSEQGRMIAWAFVEARRSGRALPTYPGEQPEGHVAADIAGAADHQYFDRPGGQITPISRPKPAQFPLQAAAAARPMTALAWASSTVPVKKSGFMPA